MGEQGLVFCMPWDWNSYHFSSLVLIAGGNSSPATVREAVAYLGSGLSRITALFQFAMGQGTSDMGIQ